MLMENIDITMDQTNDQDIKNLPELPDIEHNQIKSSQTNIENSLELDETLTEISDQQQQIESNGSLKSRPQTTTTTTQINETTQIINNNEDIFKQKQESERKLLLETLLDSEKNPKSYSTISKKEELILGYVDNFVRQYTQLYPARKNLLISPNNEFGIKVSTL